MRKIKIDKGSWGDEGNSESSGNTTQWGLVGEKTYKGLPETNAMLPAGIYNISLDRNDDSSLYTRRELAVDDVIDLEDPVSEKNLKEAEDFWSKEALFKKRGFLHRRGYLLYGPGGTGKSVIVKQMMRYVIEEGGLVFICDNPTFFNKALTTIRQAEPERKVLCVFEDIESIIAKYGDEDLLSLLDGANMVNHVLNVATTNYPERLDRRIIARPRRFDRVIKIDNPTMMARHNFFVSQTPKIPKNKLKTLVNKTEGLSLAALSEVIISVYCLGNTMEETLDILNRMNSDNPSSSEFGESEEIGFQKTDSDDEEIENDVIIS